MAVGKKTSPMKLEPITTALVVGSLVSGGIKGISGIAGGISNRMRARREQERLRKQFRKNKQALLDIDISNPFANIETEFENPFEDLTVNQQQAEFEAEQAAQSRSNIMANFREAAGGSGIASLAQALSNQATIQNARASASIGQQEARNEILAAQGAQRVQALESQAEQRVGIGESIRQRAEAQRQRDIIALRGGRDAGLAALSQQRAEGTKQVVEGIGQLAGTAAAGYLAYKGGAFGGGGSTTTTTTPVDTPVVETPSSGLGTSLNLPMSSVANIPSASTVFNNTGGSYDGLDFNDAFRKAAQDLGEGGIFNWRGNQYVVKYGSQSNDMPAPPPVSSSVNAGLSGYGNFSNLNNIMGGVGSIDPTNISNFKISSDFMTYDNPIR